MAIPEEILATVLLMDGSGLDVSPYIADVKFWINFNKAHTHANLTGVALNQLLLGAYSLDSTLVSTAVSRMASTLGFGNGTEGFGRDGSYAYHNTLYNAGYGTVLTRRFAAAAQILKGTTFQFTQANFDFLVSSLLDGFRPTTTSGRFLELSRGRQVTVQYGSAPASGLAWYIDQLKPWAGGRAVELAQWAGELKSKSINSNKSFNVYYTTDRATWHNGSASVGLAMHSERRRAYEMLQGSNKEGWYLSEGMLEVHDGDRKQFEDAWLATINRQRLPGTTVSTKPLVALPCMVENNTVAWVGGAELGPVGVAGQQLDPNLKSLTNAQHSTCRGTQPVDLQVDLLAKKSWFFFDEEVVALGADIKSTDTANRVETIVENRKTAGAPILTVNGQVSNIRDRGTVANDSTNWVHLQAASGSTVGYVFPKPTTIQLLQEQRSGSWATIDGSAYRSPDGAGSAKTRTNTREYVSIAIDHGKLPTTARYQYILLPVATPERTAAYSAAPDARVVTNSANVQAARDASSGTFAMNVWSPAGGSAGGISVSGESSIVTRASGDTWSLAISDPTQKRGAPVRVSFSSSATPKIGKLRNNDSNISVVSTSPLVLEIAPAATPGSTSTVSFELLPSTTPSPVGSTTTSTVTLPSVTTTTAKSTVASTSTTTTVKATPTTTTTTKPNVTTTTVKATPTTTTTTAPLPTLTVESLATQEPAPGVSQGLGFKFTLSSPSATDVTVSFATENGTALAGSDYRQRSAIVTIPKGTTEYWFGVSLLSDTLKEQDEFFWVNLSGPKGAKLATTRVKATIVNR